MKKSHQWLLAGLISAILSIAAFANGLGGEFVLDDRPFLVDNTHLSAPHNFFYFFKEDVWFYSNLSVGESGLYRPLFFASLWLNNQLWPGSELALHLFSLILHIAASLLLLAAIPRFLPGISVVAAGLGTCLFAVHPVHSEAVAWISAFPHLLATVFLLTSFLFHDWHRRTHRSGTLFFALLFFVFALLSNEMAVGYPLFVLVYNWVRNGRAGAFRAAPYFIVVFAYAVVRKILIGISMPLEFSNPEAWQQLPAFLFSYLSYLVLPWQQPLYLKMPAEWNLTFATAMTTALLVIFFVLSVKNAKQHRKSVIIAAAWIITALVPLMAAAFSPDARFALRSLYLPSVGLSLIFAWFVHELPVLRQKPSLIMISALLLVALATTVTTNRNWQDDGRVYRRIIAFNPAYYGGYLGLGKFMQRTGNLTVAAEMYEKSASLAENEEKTEPLEKLGLLLGESGENQRSLEIYRKLSKIEPNRASAWVGIGNNLWFMGKLDEAADAYRKAHIRDISNREACYNLVMVLRQLGEIEESTRYEECAHPGHN